MCVNLAEEYVLARLFCTSYAAFNMSGHKTSSIPRQSVAVSQPVMRDPSFVTMSRALYLTDRELALHLMLCTLTAATLDLPSYWMGPRFGMLVLWTSSLFIMSLASCGISAGPLGGFSGSAAANTRSAARGFFKKSSDPSGSSFRRRSPGVKSLSCIGQPRWHCLPVYGE